MSRDDAFVSDQEFDVGKCLVDDRVPELLIPRRVDQFVIQVVDRMAKLNVKCN